MTPEQPPMARPRIAAGVLYRNAENQVLLVKPTYKNGWDLPGGYVEPGESPHAAAVREVLEELGLALPVRKLLVVDWAPHPAEGDKLLFIFDGGLLSDEQHAGLRLDVNEIAEAVFHDSFTITRLRPERLVRRVLLAVQAALAEATTYSEHGVAVSSSEDTAAR